VYGRKNLWRFGKLIEPGENGMTSYTHTLQDYDTDRRDTLPVTITLDAVSVRVDGCGGDMRGVMIEMTKGTMKVHVYAADSEEPVTIVLPETGGLEIDRYDYDMQSPPYENDIDPSAAYVIICNE
jgi:hypothetical protein